MKRRPNIVIIDNEPEKLSFLGTYGYELRSFNDVREALVYLRETTDKSDLIIMNIILNYISGWELLRFIRSSKAYEYTPVLILTETKDKSDELLALKSGADEFIKKPYDIDILLARIDSVLRRSRWSATSVLDFEELSFANPKTNVQELTNREHTVLKLISKGYTNEQIAKELCLSKLTVKTHTKNIFKKLGVNNRTEAILVAINLELIKN